MFRQDELEILAAIVPDELQCYGIPIPDNFFDRYCQHEGIPLTVVDKDGRQWHTETTRLAGQRIRKQVGRPNIRGQAVDDGHGDIIDILAIGTTWDRADRIVLTDDEMKRLRIELAKGGVIDQVEPSWFRWEGY